MKELVTVGANYTAHVREGSLTPKVEVVVVTSETQYALGEDGRLVRVHGVDEVRFLATPEGLRLLADHCRKWAGEIEARIAAAQSMPVARPDTEGASP